MTTDTLAALVRHASAVNSVCLELPWPPSGNMNVRHAKGGHYLTAEHKRFRLAVAVIVVAANAHKRPLAGRLRLLVHASPPDRRRRDLDRVLTPIQDALMHAGLYEDDSQIDDARILRMAGKPGTCNVWVDEL